MARAVAAFNGLVGGDTRLTEVEGWLFMVCLKMARATAGKVNPDDFVDGSGYMGLAGEAAQLDMFNVDAPTAGGFMSPAAEPTPCCKHPAPSHRGVDGARYCLNCGLTNLPESAR